VVAAPFLIIKFGSHPGVEAFVEECSTFPNGKYDDQVDQRSQALNRLRAMASLPKYSPPMARPPTGDRGWMAGSAGVGSGPSGASLR
jgi:hypothetical protein